MSDDDLFPPEISPAVDPRVPESAQRLAAIHARVTIERIKREAPDVWAKIKNDADIRRMIQLAKKA